MARATVVKEKLLEVNYNNLDLVLLDPDLTDNDARVRLEEYCTRVEDFSKKLHSSTAGLEFSYRDQGLLSIRSNPFPVMYRTLQRQRNLWHNFQLTINGARFI